MENWKDITIGALIAQAIAGIWLYLRSISDKVPRKDFEKTLAELKLEHEKALTNFRIDREKALTALRIDYEKEIIGLKADIERTNAELKGFARQNAVDEVKADLRRIEAKIETKLDMIQQLLMSMPRDPK